MTGISERNALVGMICGLAVMTYVWAATTVAFTWYVFIGASVTCLVAWLLSLVTPPPRRNPAAAGDIAA